MLIPSIVHLSLQICRVMFIHNFICISDVLYTNATFIWEQTFTDQLARIENSEI